MGYKPCMRHVLPLLLLLLPTIAGCRGVTQGQMDAQPMRMWQIEYYEISKG
ncbi:MAG: hypothetical protein GY946_18220 [bacterium]|nr:hypothetical protein [bacterium]